VSPSFDSGDLGLGFPLEQPEKVKVTCNDDAFKKVMTPSRCHHPTDIEASSVFNGSRIHIIVTGRNQQGRSCRTTTPTPKQSTAATPAPSRRNVVRSLVIASTLLKWKGGLRGREGGSIAQGAPSHGGAEVPSKFTHHWVEGQNSEEGPAAIVGHAGLPPWHPMATSRKDQRGGKGASNE
jgi:hypothetical protein